MIIYKTKDQLLEFLNTILNEKDIFLAIEINRDVVDIDPNSTGKFQIKIIGEHGAKNN